MDNFDLVFVGKIMRMETKAYKIDEKNRHTPGIKAHKISSFQQIDIFNIAEESVSLSLSLGT